MVYVEKINSQLVLFLYSLIMNEEQIHRKYLPQNKKFEERVDRMIDYYGTT
jgi:hypothetical protein